MQNKRIKHMLYILSIVSTTGLLTGCGKSELLQMINRGEQIEIEVASPAFVEEEQGIESTLDWVQLSDLETNQALREDWDHALMISTAEYGKNGMLFVDASGKHVNNNTLSVAIHNREFQKLFESEDGISKLANGALSNYVDLEVEDEYKAALMAVNGYFNLIPDMEVNYANADSTIQRNEFMAMVFRADTEVQELQSDGSLTNAVGQSDYNIYAQGVVADSYLDLASKSLNNMTYNGSITRAEVVYMLVNRYFESELGAVDIKTTDVKFSDAKDGGNIAEQQKFIENGVAKDYWKSYELTYALTNPDGGLPTDLYKALVVAKQVGILEGTETRWDEAVTRSEAIEFIINALKNDDSIETFNYNQGEISGYEVTEKEETTGGSMGELTAPEIQSKDFVVEDMDPTTMYLKNEYMAKEGPNAEEFADSCYLFKGDAVSIVGVVNSYKGEECVWYRANTGEFIPAECLTTEQSTVTQTPAVSTKEPVVEENPLADMSDEDIQAALDAATTGNPDNTGATTADGRPFYGDNPDWVGGGDVSPTHNWSN